MLFQKLSGARSRQVGFNASKHMGCYQHQFLFEYAQTKQISYTG